MTITSYLPNSVVVSVDLDDRYSPGSNGSYWNATVSGSGVLDGYWNAWCVAKDINIDVGVNYTASVFSSYEPLPAGTVERPENLDLVNWIYNQDFGSQGYTPNQIQHAAWTLVESDYTDSDLKVLEIVNQAKEKGEGFVPEPCHTVGIIVVPEGGQPLIVPKEICEHPDLDVEKYVSVDGGKTWEDADNPKGPIMIPGDSPVIPSSDPLSARADDPLFKFVVTNTGDVPLENITLSDSDFDLNGRGYL